MARDDLDPRLIAKLRELGDSYGPMGVALAAADLTDVDVLFLLLHQEPSDAQPQEPPSLVDELQSALNRHSAENGSNTPDFILARYLERCLLAFDDASVARETWYGQRRKPGVS
jgi:hypothetical protein